MTRILFVCLGNICRSAMAEGVLRQMANRKGLELEIDSAGTSNWHVGNPPDERAQIAMTARGIDISAQRARQVIPSDFQRFDYILAMDVANYARMAEMANRAELKKLHMFLEFTPNAGTTQVPDPYYGDPDDYDIAFELIEQACASLCASLQAKS